MIHHIIEHHYNLFLQVLSGITFTKLLGVLVLAFAKSQIFVVSYHLTMLTASEHHVIFVEILFWYVHVNDWIWSSSRNSISTSIIILHW